MNNIQYKRLINENLYTKQSGNNFKKSYFFYSKEHQEYINFDKKHHEGEGDFLHSKFLTYINVIPFSRPPFFFAMYLGIIVPQMLFLFKRMRRDNPSLKWVKVITVMCVFFAILNLFYWFFDLFIESNNIGKHNQKINASISYGFTIFMLSEVCIFAGLFWGFFDRAFHPSVVLQSLYMPSGTHGLPSLELVFRGSFLLSLSCSAYNAMKRCLMTGDNNRARFWGFVSLLIGLTFLFQQVEEYESIPYMMSLNAHCSYFYAITGLHGFHVAIGIMFIGTIVDRIEQEKFNQYDLMSVTFAEIYWYFVDLVWFVLLIALYAYGVYHPNAVLLEKYTIIDEVKDFFFSFGYLTFDYIKEFYILNDLYSIDWSTKFSYIKDYYNDILNWFFIFFNHPFLTISVMFKELTDSFEYSFFLFMFTHPILSVNMLFNTFFNEFTIFFYSYLLLHPIRSFFLLVSTIYFFLAHNLFYVIFSILSKGYSLINHYY